MDSLQNIPKPGEFYRHFKGNLYQILAVAIHTETEEPLVIYQALYGDFQIYARPLTMFLNSTKNGEKRFVKVTNQQNYNEERSCNEKKEYDRKQEGVYKQKENQQEEIGKAEKLNKDQEEGQENYLYEQMEKFYDANSYEAKLECLLPLRGKLNDIMLRNIAVSLDIAIPENSEEEQFQSIVSCLKTMKKYQRSRLR